MNLDRCAPGPVLTYSAYPAEGSPVGAVGRHVRKRQYSPPGKAIQLMNQSSAEIFDQSAA